MGAAFSLVCACWPGSSRPEPKLKHSDGPSTGSAASLPDPDERTPLIINPPKPAIPPPQFHPDTQQQAENEAAANEIVENTVSRCLVHVYSQAPFSHLRLDNSGAEFSHTPRGSSETTWRAFDPPIRPPVSPEIRILRLGYGEQSITSNKSKSRLNNKKSYHSLKTIVNGHVGSVQRAMDLDHRSHSSEPRSTPIGPSASFIRDGADYHSRDSSCATSTQFGTIRTYQTALDDTDGDNAPDDSGPTQSSVQPVFVSNLWEDPPHPERPAGVATALDEEGYLTDDPQKLKEMIDSGFQLEDVGPILAEL